MFLYELSAVITDIVFLVDLFADHSLMWVSLLYIIHIWSQARQMGFMFSTLGKWRSSANMIMNDFIFKTAHITQEWMPQWNRSKLSTMCFQLSCTNNCSTHKTSSWHQKEQTRDVHRNISSQRGLGIAVCPSSAGSPLLNPHPAPSNSSQSCRSHVGHIHHSLTAPPSVLTSPTTWACRQVALREDMHLYPWKDDTLKSLNKFSDLLGSDRA